MATESGTRKETIDFRLKEAGWNVAERTQLIEEFFVSDVGDGDTGASPASREKITTNGTQEFSDYVLLGRNSEPIAVVEAKRTSKDAELGSRAGQAILPKYPGSAPW